MISEFFINIIFNIVTGLFSLLPDVTWNVESTAFTYFLDILKIAGYMLPMDTVAAIAGLIVALTTFRIIISIVRTIWDLLPLV